MHLKLLSMELCSNRSLQRLPESLQDCQSTGMPETGQIPHPNHVQLEILLKGFSPIC